MAIKKLVTETDLGNQLKIVANKVQVNIDGTTIVADGAGILSTSLNPQVVTDLVTLSGLAANAQNLGTFTGATIADNLSLKAAIQALETAIESTNVMGQYAGSAATFAALPTTTNDGKAINATDWAILSTDDGANQAGIYAYNGTAYTLIKEIPEVLTLSVTSTDSNSIDFSGVGTVGSPLTADIKIDVLAGNLLKVTATGTKVDPADVKALVKTFDVELQDLAGTTIGFANSTAVVTV